MIVLERALETATVFVDLKTFYALEDDDEVAVMLKRMILFGPVSTHDKQPIYAKLSEETYPFALRVKDVRLFLEHRDDGRTTLNVQLFRARGRDVEA